jgi:hypothetical protein
VAVVLAEPDSWIALLDGRAVEAVELAEDAPLLGRGASIEVGLTAADEAVVTVETLEAEPRTRRPRGGGSGGHGGGVPSSRPRS